MAQATLPLLHRFLGIGLVVLAGVAIAINYGLGPLRPRDNFTQMMAYVFSGISAALIVVALFVFRPRVPACQADQPVDQYWMTPAVTTAVLPVWFVAEGGGVLAAVGYMMTGDPIAAFAMVLTIIAFWASGPQLFAKLS